ncbi:MAG: hypothetical protein U0X93_11745 [Anaerolineales bacterium]
MRRGNPGDAVIVQFESQMSQLPQADEWIPLLPGTEGLVAAALGRLVAEAKGISVPRAFSAINVDDVAATSALRLNNSNMSLRFWLEQKRLAIPADRLSVKEHGLPLLAFWRSTR